MCRCTITYTTKQVPDKLHVSSGKYRPLFPVDITVSYKSVSGWTEIDTSGLNSELESTVSAWGWKRGPNDYSDGTTYDRNAIGDGTIYEFSIDAPSRESILQGGAASWTASDDCIEVGAYAALDADAPENSFAFIYGTRGPSFVQLLDMLLPESFSAMLSQLESVSFLWDMSLLPAIDNGASCSAEDMAAIESGCDAEALSATGLPTEKVPRPVDLSDAASTMLSYSNYFSSAGISGDSAQEAFFNEDSDPWYDTDAAVFAGDVADMFYTEWRVTISQVAGCAPGSKYADTDATPKYFQMPVGTCCCLPGENIETNDECHAAAQDLGLRHDVPLNELNPNGHPGYCSWRDRSNGQFNLLFAGGSQTNAQARSDLAPICKRPEGYVKGAGRGLHKLHLILKLGSMHSEVSPGLIYPKLARLVSNMAHWPDYEGHNFNAGCDVRGTGPVNFGQGSCNTHYGLVGAYAVHLGNCLNDGWDDWSDRTYGSCSIITKWILKVLGNIVRAVPNSGETQTIRQQGNSLGNCAVGGTTQCEDFAKILSDTLGNYCFHADAYHSGSHSQCGGPLHWDTDVADLIADGVEHYTGGEKIMAMAGNLARSIAIPPTEFATQPTRASDPTNVIWSLGNALGNCASWADSPPCRSIGNMLLASMTEYCNSGAGRASPHCSTDTSCAGMYGEVPKFVQLTELAFEGVTGTPTVRGVALDYDVSVLNDQDTSSSIECLLPCSVSYGIKGGSPENLRIAVATAHALWPTKVSVTYRDSITWHEVTSPVTSSLIQQNDGFGPGTQDGFRTIYTYPVWSGSSVRPAFPGMLGSTAEWDAAYNLVEGYSTSNWNALQDALTEATGVTEVRQFPNAEKCYDVLQRCYFAFWAAPSGLAPVQDSLSGLEGPTQILSVLPSDTSFGLSGTLANGACPDCFSVALQVQVGTCDPACGLALPGWFQFELDLTLFNVFKGHFAFQWTKNAADNPTDGLTTTESTVTGAVFLDVGKMKEKLKAKINDLMGLRSQIADLQTLLDSMDSDALCRKYINNGP
eukprot:SAG31_NODE_577_length_13952_cov_2.717121_1_plen_1031_part_10